MIPISHQLIHQLPLDLTSMKFSRNFDPLSASQCPKIFQDKRARGTLEGGISRSGTCRVWLVRSHNLSFGLSRVLTVSINRINTSTEIQQKFPR